MRRAEMKRCPRCGPLPAREFHRKTDSPDGLQGYCKTCSREYQRPWTAAVRAKVSLLSGKPLRDRAADAARRQVAVLLGLKAVWVETGRSPTLSELAARAGLKHVSSVLHYLRRLEAAGEVDLEPARGLGWNRAVWPVGLRTAVKAAALKLEERT